MNVVQPKEDILDNKLEENENKSKEYVSSDLGLAEKQQNRQNNDNLDIDWQNSQSQQNDNVETKNDEGAIGATGFQAKDPLKVEIHPKIKITSPFAKKKMSSFEEVLWYRQISVWMPFFHSQDRFEKTKSIEILKSLQIISIYDNIDVFDNLMDDKNVSKNCFTIRNDCFQKVFYVGSARNRSLGKYLAFTLRVVDQYSRHVLSIKKYYKNCCFGLYKVDVISADGTRIGRIEEKQRPSDSSIEFLIFDPLVNDPLFSVKRLSDSPVGHKFDILSKESIIGNITKIFEKEALFESSADNHYIRVNVPLDLTHKDKALILSATLIINILVLRQIKRK